jgi:hypothetical protein
MASADGEQQLPIEFELSQNYPNSFNPSTTIRHGLPEPSNIRIEIYNILGQRVATLFDGIKQPCYHNATWNAIEYHSGVYFARLETPSISKTIKMVLRDMPYLSRHF